MKSNVTKVRVTAANAGHCIIHQLLIISGLSVNMIQVWITTQEIILNTVNLKAFQSQYETRARCSCWECELPLKTPAEELYNPIRPKIAHCMTFPINIRYNTVLLTPVKFKICNQFSREQIPIAFGGTLVGSRKTE